MPPGRSLAHAFAILLAALFAVTGVAHAATGHLTRRHHVRSHSRTPSAAPSAAAQATTLSQLTGLSASQVASQSACAPAAPGYATCEAQIAVVRSTRQPVRPRVHRQKGTAESRRAFTSSAVVSPATSGQGEPSVGTPAWLQQAYDVTYLSATAGSGDTIAVIDAYNDPTAASDLAYFRNYYGLPACTTASGCFKQVNESGQTSPLPSSNSSWEVEESLDLDAISSLCPLCHIDLVEASSTSTNDLATAMETASDTMHANQLSASWSADQSSPPQGVPLYPGIPIVAATGDNGYVGASTNAFPAALPGVTAAGGTTLAAASSARGFGESAWSGAGSGCDLQEAKPSWQADSGCTGRSYADVSADANPNTGLTVYNDGGWMVVGGTSLATPLVAAFEAITGVNGDTPQWAYTDSSLLNDPASGSNGSCAAAISYICNSGLGYDGPTGIGSISGDVATGGPGVGGPTQASGTSYAQAVSMNEATMLGGIYPNGNDTVYQWQYGTTTSYGLQTPITDVGSGPAPVSVTDNLTGLAPSTTYHYRLVAQNSAGTSYGYDFTFTTPATLTAPVNTTAPAISGSSLPGQSLTATPGAWNPSGTASYQWQRNTGSGWVNVAGATANTYTTGSADLDSALRVAVADADSAGSTTADSNSIGPIATPGAEVQSPAPSSPSPPASTSSAPPAATSTPTPAPVVTAAPKLSGIAKVGDKLTVSGGSYRNGTPTSFEFERCARSCTIVAHGASSTYKLVAMDAGYYIRVLVTAAGPGGATVAAANGPIGPVQSKTTGAAALKAGRASTIRGSSGAVLARVSAGRYFAHASDANAGGESGDTQRATIQFTRTARIKGPMSVWVCVLGNGGNLSCTAPRRLRRRVSFSLSVASGERVELIVTAGH
jgi:hypothetical protein